MSDEDGEPANSILVRLSAANGSHDIPGLIGSTPGLLSPGQLSRAKLVAIAARLAGRSPEAVDAATPANPGGALVVRGHRFRHGGGRLNGRVCPDCLTMDLRDETRPMDQRPWRRDWWQLPVLAACPVHRRLLVSDCPVCRRPLDPLRSPTRCACAPSSDIAHPPGVRFAAEETVHGAWLLGRVGAGPETPHPLLDGLCPDVASRVCLVLGVMNEHVERIPCRWMPAFDREEAVRSDGWRLALDWPTRFHLLLDRRFRKEDATPSNRNKVSLYGGLHVLLNDLKDSRSEAFEFVREEVRRHARARVSVAGTTRMFGRALGRAEWLCLRQTSAALGETEKLILLLMHALGLRPDSTFRSSGELIPIKVLGKLRNFLAGVIRTSEAERALGLSRKHVRLLRERGVLRVVLPVQSRRLGGLMRRDDVDDLLLRLTAAAELPATAARGLVTLVAVTKVLRCSCVDLIAAIASGRLRVQGRREGVAGFAGCLVRADEARRAVSQATGRLSIEFIQLEEGWASRTIAQLNRMGFLERSSYLSGVDLDELARFKAKAVAANEMVGWPGAPKCANRIGGVLASRGVQPLVPRTSCVTRFWPRDRAKAAFSS